MLIMPALTPVTSKIQLSQWVTYEDSLTDKLARVKGDIQLMRLFQGWVRPSWWDRVFLQIEKGLIFQREILMGSQGIDYWYARTVIPKACYDLDRVFFSRLDRESIRHLIFDEQAVTRKSLTHYLIDSQCLEYYWVKKYHDLPECSLWLRLATYVFKEEEPFYLMELLLPDIHQVQL